MILGKEEEVIPKYYNEDEPQSAEKTRLWASLDCIYLVINVGCN